MHVRPHNRNTLIDTQASNTSSYGHLVLQVTTQHKHHHTGSYSYRRSPRSTQTSQHLPSPTSQRDSTAQDYKERTSKKHHFVPGALRKSQAGGRVQFAVCLSGLQEVMSPQEGSEKDDHNQDRTIVIVVAEIIVIIARYR